MASLNLDLDYFFHPKTRRLIGLLGKGSEAIPIRVWCFCGKYYSDTGRLTGISAQEIESEVKWWGSPGKCVESLLACKFLIQEPDGTFAVKDWLEHSGHIAAYKKRSKQAAKARWRNGMGADEAEFFDASSNATSIPSSNALSNATSNACPSTAQQSIETHSKDPPREETAAKKKLEPPTLEEVVAYCEERRAGGNPPVDPHLFFSHYEANGWVQGNKGKPIKNWKMCVHTWERSEFRMQSVVNSKGTFKPMSQRVKEFEESRRKSP